MAALVSKVTFTRDIKRNGHAFDIVFLITYGGIIKKSHVLLRLREGGKECKGKEGLPRTLTLESRSMVRLLRLLDSQTNCVTCVCCE